MKKSFGFKNDFQNRNLFAVNLFFQCYFQEK